jgi:DNA repair exonuclease SbcCD ATPase subunit
MSDDELESDIVLELQEKDEQLRLAAELGQSLLRRTEELQLANEQLLAQGALANEAVEESEWRVQELTGESARLHQLVEDKELELERKELELREAQEESAAAASASAIGRALDAVADTGGPRAAQAQAEIQRLREEVEELQEREAEVQHGWQEEGAGRRAAEKKAKKVAEQLAVTQEELQSRSAAVAASEQLAREEQAAAQSERDRVAELEVRLASMEMQVERAKSTAGGSTAVRMGKAESADSRLSTWLSLLTVCCVRLPLATDVDLSHVAALLEQAERREEVIGDAEAFCRKLASSSRLCAMKDQPRRKAVSAADFTSALANLKEQRR